ncbi:hypothetical protein DHEL01_v210223 [Diaporthe helianthi]|uniref:Uncharacterized protein n=1 Tax=Diaporthe helianthi TaxID=158607 RepID=A0A2P5HMD8_DIAHE|nr:hypothetical protein DHEL01_v210223 [Diaporthe helianthi]
MSAFNRNAMSAITGASEPKKLAKYSPASSGTEFAVELATVSNHSDLDHCMQGMQGTPQLFDVEVVDEDVHMVDAPEIEVELDLPELDSTEVFVTVEDPDTVMMEYSPLEPAELHGEDIIIDES